MPALWSSIHDDRRRYPQQLLRINDDLLQVCKFLNEKCDMETSSRLIPLVDDLTHILIEAGKNDYTDAGYREYFIDGSALMVRPVSPDWYVAGSVLVPGQFQRFTVDMKKLAKWFGLEIARLMVDECLSHRES